MDFAVLVHVITTITTYVTTITTVLLHFGFEG